MHTSYIADDGDKVIISKRGGVSVVEVECGNSSTRDFTPSPSHSMSRAQVMRQMIEEGKDRTQIKTFLVENNYDVKNFASEWFRLNK